jgi:menaquinone-dependent protoporphyrinogen oxidase
LDGYLKSFFDETGWHPKVIGRFGGALLYTRYGFWVRIPLALAGRMMGSPTDTSRDHELTNWDDVDQFADEFLSQVEARPNLSAWELRACNNTNKLCHRNKLVSQV